MWRASSSLHAPMRSARARMESWAAGWTSSVDTVESVAGAQPVRADWFVGTYEPLAAKFSHSGMDARPRAPYRARSGMRGAIATAIAVTALIAAPARAAE